MERSAIRDVRHVRSRISLRYMRATNYRLQKPVGFPGSYGTQWHVPTVITPRIIVHATSGTVSVHPPGNWQQKLNGGGLGAIRQREEPGATTQMPSCAAPWRFLQSSPVVSVHPPLNWQHTCATDGFAPSSNATSAATRTVNVLLIFVLPESG
jgi:hypothetical protein